MRRRSGPGRRDAGASTLEYAAVIAMAAILVVAVVGMRDRPPLPQFITDAICKVSAAVGIGPCADGPAAVTRTARASRGVDIPERLDPESDLVQMLLSTERGRQTLQWLADSDILIVIDPDAPAQLGRNADRPGRELPQRRCGGARGEPCEVTTPRAAAPTRPDGPRRVRGRIGR